MSLRTRPSRRPRGTAACVLCVLLLAACGPRAPSPVERQAEQAAAQPEPAWIAPLEREVEAIDAQTPGRLGVYVSRFGPQAGTLDLGGGRAWYLSSTIKVPVAVAILEAADAGELSLDEELVLSQSDFVDGAGDMLQHKPGERFAIATLLEKSLRDSDSTATDMLIRRIGQERLNARIADWVGGGFGEVTTILQVRYDAYGALHPRVKELSNMQLLRLRQAEAGEPRLQALAEALGVARSDLPAATLQEVFDDYYASGRNAARLPAFARLLERVVAGELLSEESTALLLGHMRAISTGSRRIQAGLPPGADFAQKTGTQQQRACNVGVLDAARGRGGATVVVACAEDFGELAEAERAFQALGRALAPLAASARAPG
ncbi:MAG TPA: serine hydrolase [Pseudoxanthomonas sp.]|nr:serine hydrolase [Pseudoxanthomonas sp.]